MLSSRIPDELKLVAHRVGYGFSLVWNASWSAVLNSTSGAIRRKYEVTVLTLPSRTHPLNSHSPPACLFHLRFAN